MISNEVLPVQYKFSGKNVDCFFDADFSMIEKKLQKVRSVIITDENIYAGHAEKFSGAAMPAKLGSACSAACPMDSVRSSAA